MSRYTIVLLGLLAVMVTVYAEGNNKCRRDNENLQLCGKLCEPTCKDPEPNRLWCPRIMCNKLTTACRCDEGYVRDTDSGLCVLRGDCQKEEDQKEEDQKEEDQKEEDQQEQAPPLESAE